MGKQNWSSETTRRLVMLAMLFALAMVLMVLEGLIPPVPTLPPGVKLGLSNVVVMYALFFLGKREAFTILLLKSLFAGLTRGVTACLMSASGGILSILVMIFLLALKKRTVSYIIISICAAVAHNVGQLVVSAFLMQSASVFFYLPLLVLSGIVMGIVTGLLLNVMMPVMGRVESILQHQNRKRK